jgi:hypothetical protein
MNDVQHRRRKVNSKRTHLDEEQAVGQLYPPRGAQPPGRSSAILHITAIENSLPPVEERARAARRQGLEAVGYSEFDIERIEQARHG